MENESKTTWERGPDGLDYKFIGPIEMSFNSHLASDEYPFHATLATVVGYGCSEVEAIDDLTTNIKKAVKLLRKMRKLMESHWQSSFIY